MLFVKIVHILVCVGLILIVLLQTGKGAEMGASLGGGSSQALFGPSGGATFLSKATTAIAIIFMVTSLFLAYHSGTKPSASVITDTPAATQSAPAETPAQ